MLDRLNVACKAYGMEINVKKTKVMVVGGDKKTKGMQLRVMLDRVPLEQLTR
jgi:UDP-N-acetylglucosamine enolpyruvyl transferase